MTIPPPTILVIGCNGQVGSYLAKALAPYGRVVTSDLAPLPGLPPPNELIDLRDGPALRRLVRSIDPKIIVNAAAYTAVDRAEQEPAIADQVNANAPGIMAEELSTTKGLLIHYSTDYVLPGEGSQPQDEKVKVAPCNAYGRSKARGEAAIAGTAALSTILRTSWVFSSHGLNFVKTMLRLGQEREELKVVDDQIGAPTSARFLAAMTAVVVQRGLVSGFAGVSGLYNLACAGETSWHGFASETLRLAKEHGFPIKTKIIAPIPTEAYPLPASRPRNSRLDCRKFCAAFGVTRPTWQDELAKVVAELSDTSPRA